MINRRSILKTGVSALIPLGFSPASHAQIAGNAFIYSGFPAGGMGDQVSRPMAERLRGKYAANVLVESKVGAGGRIAAEFVKRAAPDGLAILQVPSSVMAVYPSTYKKLSYDPLLDFIPVTTTVSYEFSFTAGPGLPPEIRNVAEYVRWAKANPKLASYGVPAAGSSLHFAGMLLQRAAGFEFTSVAYRGGAPLLQDVLGGQVPVSFNVLGEVLPHVRSGILRSLGTVGPKRSVFLPEVATLVEQGYPEIAMLEYLGWYLPARTPDDIVRRLNTLVREGLRVPEYMDALAKNGLQAMHQSPEEFTALLKRDIQHWAGIVKTTGFTAED